MNTYPFAHMKVNKRDLTYREDRLSSVENVSLFFDREIEYMRGAYHSITFIYLKYWYVSYYYLLYKRILYTVVYTTVAYGLIQYDKLFGRNPSSLLSSVLCNMHLVLNILQRHDHFMKIQKNHLVLVCN